MSSDDHRPPPPQPPPGAAPPPAQPSARAASPPPGAAPHPPGAAPPTGAAPPPGAAPLHPQAAGAVPAPDAAALGAQVVDYLRGPAGRAERRPTPRFSVLAAVAGAVLIVMGLLSAASLDEVPDALMTVLFLALLAGGYALVWLFRDGPLATAGATASALSLPMLLGAALANDADASLTPVVVLSLIGWFAAYLVGPGRGHVVYLGLGTGLAAVAIVIIAAGDGRLDEPGIGLLWASALIAAGYFGVGYLLDRSELSGVATAFVGPAVLLVVTGCFQVLSLAGVATFGDFTSSELSDSFLGASMGMTLADLILPGILLTALGVVALRYGVASLRRATAWSGAAALAVGVLALLIGLFGENGIMLAIAVLVLGGGVIYGAWFLSTRIGEADELAEAPSFTEVGLIQAVRDAMPVRTTDPEVWRSFGGSAWYASPAGAAGSPGPGWWVASDGNWYPPQTMTPGADPRPAPPTTAAPGDPRLAPPTAAVPPEAPTARPEARDPGMSTRSSQDPRPAPPSSSPAPSAPAPSAPPSSAPPPSAPAPSAPAPAPERAPIDDLPPAPGWWKASDGQWYPPEEK